MKFGAVYHVLGSGSSANSYVFGDGQEFFLVDAGFSCREVCRRLESVGIEPEQIKGIFLTHTHSDHVKGISVFSRKFSVPIIGHKNLDYDRSGVSASVDIEHYVETGIGCCRFTAFPTFHDSKGSSGFFLEIGGVKFAVITDTGIYTDKMVEMAAASDVLFLEANYDYDMLWNGFYPYPVKERIHSELGHLSNKDACDFINELDLIETKRTSKIYLCHLSSNNNAVNILQNELELNLDTDINIKICPKGVLVAGGQVKNGVVQV